MHARGARPRHPRDRRPRAQPLLQRPPVVPGRPRRRPGQRGARPLHLPRRPAARTASCPRTTGSPSSAATPGPASTDPDGTARPVVPAPLRQHPARLRLGQRVGARAVPRHPALLARPRRRRLPRRCRPRHDQGRGPARLHAARRGRQHGRRPPALEPGDRAPSPPPSAPYWAQDGVHDIYRDWRVVLDEYPGERILAAEAWVDPLTARRAVGAPGRDAPGVQLRLPRDAVEGRRPPPRDRRLPGRLRAVGAPSTWVLSNHDVVRHASRLALTADNLQGHGIGPKTVGLPDRRASACAAPAPPPR